MNKEEVYDNEISPLMAQIIEICQESNIAMVASFAIPTEEDEGLRCTTHLSDETGELPEGIKEAVRTLKPGRASPMMITAEREDGTKTITAVMG